MALQAINDVIIMLMNLYNAQKLDHSLKKLDYDRVKT